MSPLAILTNYGERAEVKFQGNSHCFKTCEGSCERVTESLHAALQSNNINIALRGDRLVMTETHNIGYLVIALIEVIPPL